MVAMVETALQGTRTEPALRVYALILQEGSDYVFADCLLKEFELSYAGEMNRL